MVMQKAAQQHGKLFIVSEKTKIHTNPLDECVMKGHAQKKWLFKKCYFLYVLNKHDFKINVEV